MESYCCCHACWHACHCYWSHARGVRSIERWRVCGKHLLGSGFCAARSEEHTSELQSQSNLVCRLLLEKKKNKIPFSLHKHNKFQRIVIVSHYSILHIVH